MRKYNFKRLIVFIMVIFFMIPRINTLAIETNQQFKISLAYSDGNYVHVDNADTLEEAIAKAKNLKDLNDNETVIPTVINQYGQAVYSTNSVGRVVKYFGGIEDITDENITLLYPNSRIIKDGFDTYINHKYVEDVPIIEDNGREAKIEVAAYKGWINKDSSKANYDLTIVPINQVTNPSCYYVENGMLNHFISKNMKGVNEKSWAAGDMIEVGPAPSYLKEGTDYYSYDGIYFYMADSILRALTILREDLRNNTKKNALNYDNPFYNYFNYLPYRTKSSYTADDLNRFINSNTIETSKLRGIGETIIDSQNKYGVNALLILATAIHESNFGISKTAQEKNNLFGINAQDINPDGATIFGSPSESVIAYAQTYISKYYLDQLNFRYNGGCPGNKAMGKNVRYAADPYWGEKVAKQAYKIDYYLSGKDSEKLKDYNGYKIAMYTGINSVKNSNGETLYDVTTLRTGKTSYIGNVVALLSDEIINIDTINNGQDLYEIFPDRNRKIIEGKYEEIYLKGKGGEYDLNTRAYINASNLEFINTTKDDFIPGYKKEDVNKNGQVNIEDLAKLAIEYNVNIKDVKFKKYLDLNSDGTIDILDIVQIAMDI